MKILFDQGTPVPLRKFLQPHRVDTASELGWSSLSNGDLLAEAEKSGFQCMVTTDQNLKYQQNISERSIAIVVLMSTSWPRISKRTDDVTAAIQGLTPGAYIEIEIT